MRFINISEIKIPMGFLSDQKLSTGDVIKFEMEIVINEPTIYGFNGLVHSIKPVGKVYLPRVNETENE